MAVVEENMTSKKHRNAQTHFLTPEKWLSPSKESERGDSCRQRSAPKTGNVWRVHLAPMMRQEISATQVKRQRQRRKLTTSVSKGDNVKRSTNCGRIAALFWDRRGMKMRNTGDEMEIKSMLRQRRMSSVIKQTGERGRRDTRFAWGMMMSVMWWWSATLIPFGRSDHCQRWLLWCSQTIDELQVVHYTDAAVKDTIDVAPDLYWKMPDKVTDVILLVAMIECSDQKCRKTRPVERKDANALLDDED